MQALAGRLADEGLLVAVVVLFTTLAAAAAHGLPRVDTLTVLAHGRHWIDQQWLAQLASYELDSRLGLAATLAVFVAMIVIPFALACVLARRRGASSRSVAIFALAAAPAAICAVRAQSFSCLLFVPFLALLAAESRRPSRRVWLVFPALALWANLHGTVLVAAALVAILGLSDLVAGRRVRGLALMVAPWPCIFASPYGLSLVEYYHSTVGNPLFKQFISEWAPPTFPTSVGVPFFLIAAIAIGLLARRPRDLTFFELGALALTLVGGLTAARSITWFTYAALLFLPAVLERSWPQQAVPAPARRVVAAAVVGAFVVFGVTLSGASARASDRMETAWPRAAVQAVRTAVDADPQARVVAGEGIADWLLYAIPELRGRIVFDGRWEVLSLRQFQTVHDYLKQSGPDWQRVTRGASIIVVDPKLKPALYRFYRAHGLRVLYRGSRVAVFRR
jgi:hypothetical protein